MNYKEKVEVVFNQWKEYGTCEDANILNEKIGVEYFDTTNPQFFTGNIDAEVVLIHLNPKRNQDKWNKKCTFSDFQSYWDFYENFGKNHYGNNSPRKNKSKFDSKQVRFLRPLEVLPINNEDHFKNIENVIDKKLQIELVPFGSPDFDFKKIKVENLTPFIENIISLIASKPRKYVIFCGKVFEKLIKDSIKSEVKYVFKLDKKDGSKTKRNFSIVNIALECNNEIIKACIAPQFALQGCPITEYGKKVKELYGKGL